MIPQLKVLKGARKGHAEVFSKTPIALGRHPASDLQLDPERDLQVSARHALLVRRDVHWYVRDAGSRNGTFVNGHRITSDTKLDDTDQIRLGDAQGPVIEVRLVPDGTPVGIKAPAQPLLATEDPSHIGEQREPRPTAAGHQLDAPASRGSATSERIRIEVGKQTRRMRRLTVVAFILLAVSAAAFFLVNQRQNAVRAAEVEAIRVRTDSLLASADRAMRDLQGQVQGLGDRLQESRSQVSRLQGQLDAAQESGTRSEIAELRRQLADAAQALTYQQVAAQVDYTDLVRENQLAVAMIWARYADRSVVTGTAFAVRPSALLVTNRHLVAGDDGRSRPVELAVKFADSRQVWPARVESVSPDADLALIQVEGIVGDVPVVHGLGGSPEQGDPVAIIGFPMGADLPGAGNEEIARTTFTAGSVSKVLPDVLQVDGYGVEGASGSPIFDRDGNVIAVLFGGEPGSSGRIVYGVPASYLVQLVDSIR